MSTNEMDILGDRSSVQSGMAPFESNNFLLHTVVISVLSSTSFRDKKITISVSSNFSTCF